MYENSRQARARKDALQRLQVLRESKYLGTDASKGMIEKIVTFLIVLAGMLIFLALASLPTLI